MKFKTKEISHQGKQYCFVTKGNQKITEEEIAEYLATTTLEVPEMRPAAELWSIPEGLRKMFLSDLRLGIKFCTKKYCATSDQIMAEARRIAPEVNLDTIIKKD